MSAELLTVIRMALRDMRGGIRHIRLFFACLMLGVGVMACVGSMVSAIKSGVQRDAKGIVGGDLEIRQLYQPIEKEAQDFLAQQGTLSRTLDMRSMAEANGRRILVEFKGVDDVYPLYGALKTEPALSPGALFAKRDGRYGVAVEEVLLEALQLNLGDTLHIGTGAFTVRAVLTHEPDRSMNLFAIGIRVLTSIEGFHSAGLMVPGSMINHRYRVKLPAGYDIDALRSQLDTHFTDAKEGWNIRDHREATPMFNTVLDRLSLFFSLTGLTTLITAGLGISNAVSSYLWTRRETIATLKVLGARRWHIHAIYLFQLFCAALLAILAGLALGIVAEYALIHLLEDVLPVQGVQTVYAEPLAISAAFGLITTLLFSLWPLHRASLTKPAALFRGAEENMHSYDNLRLKPVLLTVILATIMTLLAVLFTGMVDIPLYFAAGMIGALLLFSGIGALLKSLSKRSAHHGRKSLSLVMALANLARPGSATTSIVVALGIGMSLMVALALTAGNLKNQIASELPEKAPAFFLVDIQTDQIPSLVHMLQSLPGVSDVAHMPMIRARLSRLNGAPADPEKIAPDARWAVRGDRGVTWSATPPKNTDIVEGAWWPADYQGPPLVSFDAKLAHGMGLKLGDTITLYSMGQEITARIANLRSINWGTLEMNFATILSPGATGDLPVTHLATVVADRNAEWPVMQRLGEEFPSISIIRIREALTKIAELLDSVTNAVLLTAGLTILCGVLVIASALNASLQRRIYDTVILKVLGVTRPVLMRIYMLEFALMSFAVALLALVLGSIIAYSILQLMIFSEFHLLPEVVLPTLAGALLLSITLGLISTRRALKVKPLSLLRNE